MLDKLNQIDNLYIFEIVWQRCVGFLIQNNFDTSRIPTNNQLFIEFIDGLRAENEPLYNALQQSIEMYFSLW
jgi:hypothetical protein